MNTANNIIDSDAVNYQLDYFDQFGTLPTNYIECTVTGNAVTCFGTNLKKKIEQYGDLKTLLTTFTSKGAVKKTAKTKVDQVKEDLKKAVKAAKTKTVKIQANGVDLGEVEVA
jgi:S-adenosylmethionine hydrolase